MASFAPSGINSSHRHQASQRRVGQVATVQRQSGRWSANRLGLVASSDGRLWIRLGAPDPTARKPRRVVEGEPGGAFDADLVGHRPVEGLDALIAEEDRHRR